MQIGKAEIIAALRSRGLWERADWVNRTLPPAVDTSKNGSLLRMLHIDPARMSAMSGAKRDG